MSQIIFLQKFCEFNFFMWKISSSKKEKSDEAIPVSRNFPDGKTLKFDKYFRKLTIHRGFLYDSECECEHNTWNKTLTPNLSPDTSLIYFSKKWDKHKVIPFSSYSLLSEDYNELFVGETQISKPILHGLFEKTERKTGKKSEKRNFIAKTCWLWEEMLKLMITEK